MTRLGTAATRTRSTTRSAKRTSLHPAALTKAEKAGHKRLLKKMQEWMADESGHAISLTVTGSDWSTKDALLLQQHPEILLLEVDVEEDAIEQLASEQLRLEKEKLEALNKSLVSGFHRETTLCF